ncbi:MAG: response regulator transcription factor, partial [Deltaproteobacteria bacterium]
LALAAYFLGRDADYIALLQRAYHAHLAPGARTCAARAAFWLGLRLLFRGESGQGNGWLGRAQRLLDEEHGLRVEQGYLWLAATQLRLAAGDLDAASSSAAQAVSVGERFVEPDLIAIGRHLLGLVRLQQGKVQEGLGLLDEAMVAVTGGELSPLVTGLIYCGVIEGCQEIYALGRAREWTHALAGWCDEQPEMVAFAGICSVHRAEILQLCGAWQQAFEEAERACVRCRDINRRATAAAFYQQAELHRLRGALAAAEQAYQAAHSFGCEPQPGLSLLRLRQGRREEAAQAIRGAVGTTHDRSRRARLLPAYVEILLACDELEAARGVCRELCELAEHFDSGVLRTVAREAEGALQLAAGNVLVALQMLRQACLEWQELDAPYLAARVRVRIALCCCALGDADGERLERETARSVFERLGALPDLAALQAEPPAATRPGSLTARELEVLRLVAAGNTNKGIARTLALSEKTVERHISNIFTKLDVGSRTAAAAYAYEHRLL